MGLSNDLRAAVELAPPPRFDLDQLIRRGRVRKVRSDLVAGSGRSRRWAWSSRPGYAIAAGLQSAGPEPGRLAAAGRAARRGGVDRAGEPDAGPSQFPRWVNPDSPATEVTPAEQANAARLTAALGQLPAELRVPTDGSVHIRPAPPSGAGHVLLGGWDAGGLYVNVIHPRPEPVAGRRVRPGRGSERLRG